MIVCFNGRFVPEEQAMVPISDRSFRYGDGLFEAVLARNGKLFRWEQHMDRMERSASYLRMPLPASLLELRTQAEELLDRNELRDAILRVTLSRGTGPRGYVPRGTEKPVLIMTADPAPGVPQAPVKVITSTLRVAANDTVARHKTASRLLNVLAAMEASDAGAYEALLVDTEGNVTEGASSNVFWIENGMVCTSPMASAVLPGVTRQVVLDLCGKLQIPTAERTMICTQLPHMDGLFLTMTSRGIVEAEKLDDRPMSRSPLTAQLAAALKAAIDQECS